MKHMKDNCKRVMRQWRPQLIRLFSNLVYAAA